MKMLIKGICGFAGSSIAKTLLKSYSNLLINGLDNFSRKGSELNTSQLSNLGINRIRGDIRSQSDIDAIPNVDWVIDCAANPSVLAGLDGKSSSMQLVDHCIRALHCLRLIKRENFICLKILPVGTA